ncbi:MFS transporter, partial [Chloroflexota bacterium]
MQLKTKVLYLASLVAFMRSFSQVIYVPSQVDILHDLEMTTALFGLTLSVFALTFAVAQLFLGPVVDRYNSKRILIAGMLLFSIGSLGGIFVQNIEVFFLIRMLQALGIAAAVIVGLALISDIVPGSERGGAMGTFEILNAAGAAAGPIIGALMAIWIGWRVDFLLLGLLGIALALIAYWQLPDQAVRTEKAVSICGSDLDIFKGAHPAAPLPVPAGHEIAGEVQKVGNSVNKLKPGDRVAIEPVIVCEQCYFCQRGEYSLCENISFQYRKGQGGFTPLFIAPEKWAHPLPPNISYAEGALVEPLSVALHAIKKSNLGIGDNSAIFGAGAIGLLLLMLVKSTGGGDAF